MIEPKKISCEDAACQRMKTTIAGKPCVLVIDNSLEILPLSVGGTFWASFFEKTQFPNFPIYFAVRFASIRRMKTTIVNSLATTAPIVTLRRSGYSLHDSHRPPPLVLAEKFTWKRIRAVPVPSCEVSLRRPLHGRVVC